MSDAKRITKATIKSFIRKNRDELHVLVKSSFDGMTDCIENVSGSTFEPAKAAGNEPNTLGIDGVWLAGGSRNHFNAYDDGIFTGITGWNCCGEFTVAIRKA